MALQYADRVRVSITSTGTGTASLGSAAAGFRTFAAAVTAGSLVSGCTVYYAIEDTGNAWETGSGVYTAGSPDTLSRVVAASSLGGTTALTLSGTAIVYITATAGMFNNLIVASVSSGGVATGTLSATGTVSGTGFTTLLAPYAPLASPALTGSPTIGSGGATLTGAVLQATGTSTTTQQLEVQNLSSGTTASTDLVATANDGTDTTYYVDLGINSSGNTDGTFTIAPAHDAYLYSSSSNLAIGTATAAKNITLFTGGTMAANARVVVADTGVTIGSPTGGAQGVGTINATGLFVNGVVLGTYTLPTASTTVLGGVKIDGSSITIASGVISSAGGGAGGGAVSTPSTNQTLTSASSRAQSYAFTASNLTVTLPNATTLSAGGPVFSLYNAGGYTFGVLRADGSLLTAIPPGAAAELYLDSNGTSAGVWHAVGQNLQSAYEVLNNTLSANLGQSATLIGLIGAVAIYWGYSGTSTYLQAFDTAGNTAGTAPVFSAQVLLTPIMLPISSTQAALFYSYNQTVYAIVLTLSGTTISTGSTANIATGSTAGIAAAVTLTQGSSYLVGYNTGASCLAVQLGVSGTTPTFGTAVLFGVSSTFATTNPLSVISATQVFGVAAATTSACRVIGISGTTVTMNTTANATTAPTIVQMLSTTLFVTSGGSTGVLQAFSVSGTAVTAGTQLAAQYGMTNAYNLYAVSATAFIVFGINSSNYGTIGYFTISGTTITAASGLVVAQTWQGSGITSNQQPFIASAGYIYIPTYGLFNGTNWALLQNDMWPDLMAGLGASPLQDGSGGVMLPVTDISLVTVLATAQTSSNLLVKPGRVNPVGSYMAAMSGAISTGRFLIGTVYPGRTVNAWGNVTRVGVWVLAT